MLLSISFPDSKRHSGNGRRIRSGLRRWAVILLMGVVALSVAAIPVQAQNPAVTLALSSDSISEKGGTTTVTATVSPASTTAFTVTVAASPGSGTDFTLSSSTTLSFEADATASTGTVTITAIDNDVDAADKSVTVSGTVSLTGVEAPTDKTLTITDDDTRGVTVSPTALTVVEGDDNTYTVKLDSQPTASVTVGIAKSDGFGRRRERGLVEPDLLHRGLEYGADGHGERRPG